MMLSRTLLVLFVSLISCSGAWAADGKTRLNIIFILADDLGYGDLGCYGQERIKTPNIDQLAAQGLRFTQAYAGSTVCAPSRCSLMTGLHTGHCTIRGNADVPLRDQDVTVAEVLKQAGYRTGLVGKWGLGEVNTSGHPNRQGFDYFYGYLDQTHAHNYYPDHLWRNEERIPLPNKVAGGVSSNKQVYSHDLIEQEAMDFIHRERANPFFLYLAVTIPHANNEAKQFGMEVPDLGEYADRDWPDQEKAKAAMISRLDRHVGQLMNRLEELKISENTIVIFTSDNGPHKEGGSDPNFFDSNGPLRGIKRDLYEGGIRVPTIAHRPGHIKAGETTGQIFTFWDFLPTAAELAGAPSPDVDGISIVPTLLGKSTEQKQHEYIYWEFFERGFQQAARSGPWKAVRLNRSEPLALFNLENDLGEEHDVASDRPEVVKTMNGYFKEARTESQHWSTTARAKGAAKAKKQEGKAAK